MGNISENKLNAAVTAADLTTINTALTSIGAKIPALALTPEQRQTLKAIDVDNKNFCQDAVAAVTNYGTGIIPGFIAPAFIQNDLALYEQMDNLESLLTNLLNRVSDVKRVAGDEAYTCALAAYKIFEGASLAGVMNAKTPYEKLRERFESQGRPAAKDDTE